MRVITDDRPGDMLKNFGYVKCYSQSKPSIVAEHGTFWFNGKKYLVEFVKTLSDSLPSRWVISKVSLYLKPSIDDTKELVYHIVEERMQDRNRKRNAFLFVVNNAPIVAVFDNGLGLVKVYDMDDLAEGIMVKLWNECLRFRPKTYENVIQSKTVVSFMMGKDYVLLEHEQSKQLYDFFARFFVENQLKERLK